MIYLMEFRDPFGQPLAELVINVDVDSMNALLPSMIERNEIRFVETDDKGQVIHAPSYFVIRKEEVN